MDFSVSDSQIRYLFYSSEESLQVIQMEQTGLVWDHIRVKYANPVYAKLLQHLAYFFTPWDMQYFFGLVWNFIGVMFFPLLLHFHVSLVLSCVFRQSLQPG